jgi:type II secretory pathway pseudopilin PulG
MKKGFTLVEVLVVMILIFVIIGAVLTVYLISVKIFKEGKELSDLTEDARIAITTLNFIFSRWGMGVPCANNTCVMNDTLASCNVNLVNGALLTPPELPQDPMCITINNTTKEIYFFANLEGFGFVVNSTGSIVNVVSCRLNTSLTQNCYYIWRNGVVLNPSNNTYFPSSVPLNGTINGIDCINTPAPNAQLNAYTSGIILEPGDYITRVPYLIRIYVKNINGINWLMIKKIDLATACNNNEHSVKLAPVKDFSAEILGRAVKLTITFVNLNSPDKTITIEKIYSK